MKDSDSGEIQTPPQTTIQHHTKPRGCSTYAFEFISIFVAVALAFALNHWNDNRRDRNVEVKILKEIANGLQKDIEDIKLNVYGHNIGIQACHYWRALINGEPVNEDSLAVYLSALTRNFISIQNRSGYESLKSKGLELIQDDSLRFAVISMYEYDFNILKTLEEDYHEMQFHANYAADINRIIVPHCTFNRDGQLSNISTPLKLSKAEEGALLMYLAQIQMNRDFALRYYRAVELKVTALEHRIKQALKA